MKVEGVLFIDSEVVKMKKKEFIEKMKAVHYQDRSLPDRELLLGDIYDRISESGKKHSDRVIVDL